MEFTISDRIQSLESKRAQLQAELDKGGEYVSDGYECVEWDSLQEPRISQINSEIQEIDTILSEMRKLRNLEVTIFIKSTKTA